MDCFSAFCCFLAYGLSSFLGLSAYSLAVSLVFLPTV